MFIRDGPLEPCPFTVPCNGQFMHIRSRGARERGSERDTDGARSLDVAVVLFFSHAF